MKGTVKTVVAITGVMLVAGTQYSQANQDQEEDAIYGSGVTASVGAPYQRVADDRDHDNYLLFNLDDSDQPDSFVSYVRGSDDRDHREDLVHGSGESGQPDGFSPYVASQ